MTRVEFFFNVPDKLAKVSEICAKALAKGHQITVISRDDELSSHLQQRLWQHAATSFLPSATPADAIRQGTPIVLGIDGEALLQDDILINLQTAHPPFFGRFRLLVELVGTDDDDKVAARVRFRFYRDRGYEVKSMDMALS
jgi:DNA polymerase-3 subunit chi